jgi:hypothetical protein
VDRSQVDGQLKYRHWMARSAQAQTTATEASPGRTSEMQCRTDDDNAVADDDDPDDAASYQAQRSRRSPFAVAVLSSSAVYETGDINLSPQTPRTRNFNRQPPERTSSFRSNPA